MRATSDEGRSGIDLKTRGLTIAQSLSVRADQVIEKVRPCFTDSAGNWGLSSHQSVPGT